MPTPSPTRCASRFRRCASDSASHGSSQRFPASGTASIPGRTPPMREVTMDSQPGLIVRLKLTLSYAGFVVLAGALLLGAVWAFLLRNVPRGETVIAHGAHVFVSPSRGELLRDFGPAAAIVLTGLVIFGLLGGWLLAGRMLSPLTRITEATRIAATGSLSYRIHLPALHDEVRELADSFD